jgi:inorganic pyrophosphatase
MGNGRPRLEELASWSADGVLHVVVETPRGSGVKLKFDPELGAMTLSRPLPLGVVYPFDFGFVPRTLGEDGDPLDAAVLLDVGTFPGVVLKCRPIGIVRASQKSADGRRVRNDRLITVADGDRRRAGMLEARDLGPRARDELEQFLFASVALEGKELALLGWGDAAEARAAVEQASVKGRPRSA